MARAGVYFPPEDIDRVLDLTRQMLLSGKLTTGPVGAEFEKRFAELISVRHAVAVSSGGAALEIALKTIGVEGREVVVPPETFVASVNSVILAGGRPVFAEIHPDTLCLDLRDVERRITSQTAAVMLVHMGGLIPPNIDEFVDLCADRDLALIEDAAHAHGASHRGKKAGAFGRMGCFSFYPTKLITSAEGGMITTDDEHLAGIARSYRNHGANAQVSAYVRVSNNMRLSEPCAALGLVQMDRLEEFVRHRNRIAAVYNRGLSGVKNIRTLPLHPDTVHSYWIYLVMLEAHSISRQQFASHLLSKFGVETAWPYDPPCHRQPVFLETLGSCSLPVTDELMNRHIALPIHVRLSEEDAEYVVESIIETLSDLEAE